MQIEATLAELVEDGWRVERLATEDEEGEPYRVHIQLRLDGNEDRGVY